MPLVPDFDDLQTCVHCSYFTRGEYTALIQCWSKITLNLFTDLPKQYLHVVVTPKLESAAYKLMCEHTIDAIYIYKKIP